MIKAVIRNGIENINFSEASGLENFSFYHTRQWCEVLHNTFGWEMKSVEAYEKDKLVFFVPFVSKYRFDGRKYNVSLPLSHRVEPAYKSGVKKELKHVFVTIKELGHFEVHDKILSSELVSTSDHTRAVLDLSKFDDIDQVFNNLSKSSIQRKIKKAQKEGVVVKKENSKKSFVDFTELQNRTRKRQGSPAYPGSFFTNIHKFFKNTGYIDLFVAYYNKKPVAGVIFTYSKDTAVYSYGASFDDRELLRLGINQTVMWEAIKESYKNGRKIIDFGKTPNSHTSLKEYKEKWGAVSYPLYYSYTEDINKHQINREGLLTRVVSWSLQKCPYVVFKKSSPYLLNLVS